MARRQENASSLLWTEALAALDDGDEVGCLLRLETLEPEEFLALGDVLDHRYFLCTRRDNVGGNLTLNSPKVRALQDSRVFGSTRVWCSC